MFFYLDRDLFQAYLHKKSFGLVLGLGFHNFWVFGFEFRFGHSANHLQVSKKLIENTKIFSRFLSMGLSKYKFNDFF